MQPSSSRNSHLALVNRMFTLSHVALVSPHSQYRMHLHYISLD